MQVVLVKPCNSISTKIHLHCDRINSFKNWYFFFHKPVDSNAYMYSTQTTAQLTKEYRPKLNHRCGRARLKKLFTTKPEQGFVTPDPIKHIVEPSLTLQENHCQAVATKSSHYCNIIGSCKQVYYLVKPVDHNAKSIPSCSNVMKNLVDHITELNSHMRF